MAGKQLTSADVVYALVEARAVGTLNVSGDNPVVITGPEEDRELARAVLKRQGLTLTPYPERDEWTAYDPELYDPPSDHHCKACETDV